LNEIAHDLAVAFNMALDGSVDGTKPKKKGAPKLTLAKSSWPPGGKGWEAIPKGRKGGYRRKVRGGDYEYVYPDKKVVPQATTKRSGPKSTPFGVGMSDKQALALDLEKDPGRTYKHLKGGEIVKVAGVKGLFRYAPKHKKAGEGRAWVRSVTDGEHKLVRQVALTPMRRKVAPAAIAKPKVSAKAPAKVVKPVVLPKITRTNEGPDYPAVGDAVRKMAVFKDSRAKKGTVLYDLENAKYPIKKYGGHGTHAGGERKWRYGAYVPTDKQAAFLSELAPLLHGAASQVCRRFHIKKHVKGHRTAAYDEILAGAHLGLVMALTRYKGGSPFLPMAQQYAVMYALRQARNELGAGTRISDRAQRMLGRYVAARHYARFRRNNYEPTPEDIVKNWQVRKKDVYLTKGAIGLRPTEQGMIEQGDEELPMENWRVMDPKGNPIGKERLGKLALMEVMESLMRGDRVGDTEWMGTHPGDLPGVPHASTLAETTAYAFQDQVRSVLDAMPEKAAIALRMHFGLDRDEPAKLPEIATAIGMGAEFSDSHRYKMIREARVLEQALATFKRIAVAKDLAIAHYLDKFAIEHGPSPIAHVDAPSHAELKSQFKTDERVNIYLTAVKHGDGPRVERILDAEVEGGRGEVFPRSDRTEDESEALRSQYMKWRNEDRIAAFHEQTKMIAVDPAVAKPTGPETGEKPTSQGLYADEVWTDYLIAAGKVGRARAAFPAKDSEGNVSWTPRDTIVATPKPPPPPPPPPARKRNKKPKGV